MRLIEALKMAEACGLSTVGEAVMNIELHAGSLFPYQDLPLELAQLESEASAFDENVRVKEAIAGLLDDKYPVPTCPHCGTELKMQIVTVNELSKTVYKEVKFVCPRCGYEE